MAVAACAVVTAAAAATGVGVVVGVAVEDAAQLGGEVVVEVVGELVDLVDQVDQVLRRERVGVDQRRDQQVPVLDREAQARPLGGQLRQVLHGHGAVAELREDRSPHVQLRPVLRDRDVEPEAVDRDRDVAVLVDLRRAAEEFGQSTEGQGVQLLPLSVAIANAPSSCSGWSVVSCSVICSPVRRRRIYGSGAAKSVFGGCPRYRGLDPASR